MKLLFSIALLALSTGDVAAKCAERSLHVFGKVETAPGVPAKGVPVGVSWLAYDRAAGPALALTAADGTFSIRFGFSRFSGSGVFGDRCKARLSHVSVAAYGADVVWEPVQISVDENSDEIDAGVLGRRAAAKASCERMPCPH
jgi:hypothetical protein